MNKVSSIVELGSRGSVLNIQDPDLLLVKEFGW